MSRDDLEAQRALFEAWGILNLYSTNKWEGDGSSYTSSHTMSAWEAWKAAIAAQAPVQRESVAGDTEEAARLDWLESMGNEPGGILLHDGGGFTGRRGLGLRRIGRTIRAAIDAARKAGT